MGRSRKRNHRNNNNQNSKGKGNGHGGGGGGGVQGRGLDRDDDFPMHGGDFGHNIHSTSSNNTKRHRGGSGGHRYNNNNDHLSIKNHNHDNRDTKPPHNPFNPFDNPFHKPSNRTDQNTRLFQPPGKPWTGTTRGGRGSHNQQTHHHHHCNTNNLRNQRLTHHQDQDYQHRHGPHVPEIINYNQNHNRHINFIPLSSPTTSTISSQSPPSSPPPPSSERRTRFCTECSTVRRANLTLRDWLTTLLVGASEVVEGWSDKVGVGDGSGDEMDWQPEPVVRVLILTTTTTNPAAAGWPGQYQYQQQQDAGSTGQMFGLNISGPNAATSGGAGSAQGSIYVTPSMNMSTSTSAWGPMRQNMLTPPESPP